MGRHDILVLLAVIAFMFAWIRGIKSYLSNGGHFSYSFKPALRSVQLAVKHFFTDLTVWWGGARIKRMGKKVA